MCLWCGIMKIAQSTNFIEKFTRILKPLINFLFPDIKNNNKAKKEIAMNISANILGIGNAATPFRFKSNGNTTRGKQGKRYII